MAYVKSVIVQDTGGEQATVTSNKLDVNATTTPATGSVQSIDQDVVASATNSSTTNLEQAVNARTFTGTYVSTLGVAGIQVSLFANQNCLVKVQQSPDHSNWDISDQYNYTASSNFGVTVQAVSSYVRVVVTSLADTTTFRLQTCMCPVVEAVPRSLDVNQNFKIANPQDAWGYKSLNSPTDELRVAETVRLVGAMFDTTLDSQFWTTSVSAFGGAGVDGTATVSGAELVIGSGTGSGGNFSYAKVYSRRRARFVTSSSLKFRAHIRLGDTGTANNKRRWGVAWGSSMPTITDGAYFELDGTTFSVVTMKGSSETRVSSGAFNGSLGYTYAPTTSNTVYEMALTNSGVKFIVGGVVLHTVTASSGTWANTMSPHVYFDSVNAAVVAATTLNVRSANISRIGQLQTAPTYYNLTGNAATHTLKLGGGILHRIIFNNTSGTSFIIYDNTSAAVPIVGSVTTASAALGSWDYDMPFNTGLVIVTTGNGLDLTVVYE